MAERTMRTASWRKVTYAEALALAKVMARRCFHAIFRPSGRSSFCPATSVDHPMLSLGALYAGIAYAPISPAYSLISTDFGKLREIFNLLTPGLVFAATVQPFEKAIETIVPAETSKSSSPAIR